ncbi:MAG TPA: hypothetical protein VFJ90_02920 [Candidatus Didemnitutus sp.]|nr:hypothetical protein [Candidatus Didemnitutus sp.]
MAFGFAFYRSNLQKGSMGESDEAPPRQYKLRQKEFERVEPLAPPPAAPAPELDARAKAGDPNDVFALRQQLRAREESRGMDVLKEAPPKKSRRKRDYWLLMIGGNGFFLALPTLVFRGNGVVALYCGAGIIMLSLGATWVMWFIMDDY